MGAQTLPSQPTVPPKIVANVVRPPERSGRRRRRRENSGSAPKAVKFPNIVPGSVTILKRGEELKTMTKSNKSAAGPPSDADEKSPKIDEARSEKKVGSSDPTPSTVCLLGPSPKMVSKQSRIPKPIGVIYAGSWFNTSPEPSSLPLPRFLGKAAGKSDPATDYPLRLLRLDLL